MISNFRDLWFMGHCVRSPVFLGLRSKPNFSRTRCLECPSTNNLFENSYHDMGSNFLSFFRSNRYVICFFVHKPLLNLHTTQTISHRTSSTLQTSSGTGRRIVLQPYNSTACVLHLGGPSTKWRRRLFN